MENESITYELRIFLIGDIEVGKRTISSRFKMLNTTKTSKDKYFVPRDPHDAYGLGKVKNPKLFSIYNSKTLEQKLCIRKEIERLELMTFVKEININHVTITLNFFPILEAEPLPNNYEPKEEDEDFEFESTEHMSLRNVKSEIKKYLLKDPKSTFNNVINLFLFCYDLSDYITFERIHIYYDQLNKYFNFAQNEYLVALIGNKVDVKLHFTEIQKQSIKKFIETRRMKHYEISTLMFFNFEKFFESLFFDVLGSIDDFQKKTFKERMQLLLAKRPNFSNAARITYKSNNIPGPDSYNNDVYEYYTDKKLFKDAFDNTANRFMDKIFINKQGPIFPPIQKDMKKIRKKDDVNKEKKLNADIGLKDWDVKYKKDLNDTLECNVPGYSLGIRPATVNYKRERKEKFKEQIKGLNDALLENNVKLHIKQEPRIRNTNDFQKYENNKKNNFQSNAKELNQLEDKRKKQIKKNLEKNEKEKEKKMKEIEERTTKYNEKFVGKEREIEKKKNEARRATSAIGPRVTRLSTPGPNAYDIRGKIDTKKGFTFGTKPVVNDYKNINDPGYFLLQSDFDLIAKNPKYAEKRSNQNITERFPQPKIFVAETPKELAGKWQNWEDNKNYLANSKKQNPFFSTRKKKLESAKERREEIDRNRELEIKEKIRNHKNSDLDDEIDDWHYKNINYNQVEERAPIITMKKKYTHGGIFDAPLYDRKDNELDVNNIDEIDGDTNSQNKMIQDLPQPQYSIGKSTLIGFTFGQAKRFISKKVYEPNKNLEEKMLFEDGVFAPPDQTSYLKVQGYMGKGKKNDKLVPSTIPGPGLYKIPGFADIIVKEGEKMNRVKTAIRLNNKMQKEMELEKKEKANYQSNKLNRTLTDQNMPQNKELLGDKEEKEHHQYVNDIIILSNDI